MKGKIEFSPTQTHALAGKNKNKSISIIYCDKVYEGNKEGSKVENNWDMEAGHSHRYVTVE